MERQEFNANHFFVGELLPKNGILWLFEFLANSPEKKDLLVNSPLQSSLNPAIAGEIADRVGLVYLPEVENDGNVCTANNPEVIPEFREVCTAGEIMKYVISSITRSGIPEKLQNPGELTSISIPYPKDSTDFWKLVNSKI